MFPRSTYALFAADTQAPRQALLDGKLQQGCAPEKAMRKLAVGHGNEKGQHTAQMQRQRERQGRCFPQRQQRQTADAAGQQKRNKAQVHGLLRGVGQQAVLTSAQNEQAHRTGHQTQATQRAQKHWQA